MYNPIYIHGIFCEPCFAFGDKFIVDVRIYENSTGGLIMKKVFILLMIIALILPTTALAKTAQVVMFDDPVLETEIRRILAIPEGDVTDKDLTMITNLSIGRNYEQNPDPTTQVHSIAVLAYCTKLNSLQLNFHNISDITALSNLKSC